MANFKYLDPRQAANYLGVSYSHVYTLTHIGKLPSMAVGKHHYYDPADLDRYKQGIEEVIGGYYDIDTAAKKLRRSRMTIWGWVKSGKIKSKKVGKKVYVDPIDIDAMANDWVIPDKEQFTTREVAEIFEITKLGVKTWLREGKLVPEYRSRTQNLYSRDQLEKFAATYVRGARFAKPVKNAMVQVEPEPSKDSRLVAVERAFETLRTAILELIK